VAISPKLLSPGEEVVISTRTHAKALLLPLLVLVVCLAVAVYVQTAVDTAVLHWAVWLLALVAILWWSGRRLVGWLTATYTLTNRRLITRRGLITRKGHDIPLSRISDVEYEFGLIDRLLGCGTLMISDASTGGEVTLHDIPHVERTQRTLNELLHRLNDPSAQDEGV
jgi:uncharacterized membrane protein YdbT with pleckstrin-like domain